MKALVHLLALQSAQLINGCKASVFTHLKGCWPN